MTYTDIIILGILCNFAASFLYVAIASYSAMNLRPHEIAHMEQLVDERELKVIDFLKFLLPFYRMYQSLHKLHRLHRLNYNTLDLFLELKDKHE